MLSEVNRRLKKSSQATNFLTKELGNLGVDAMSRRLISFPGMVVDKGAKQ